VKIRSVIVKLQARASYHPFPLVAPERHGSRVAHASEVQDLSRRGTL